MATLDQTLSYHSSGIPTGGGGRALLVIESQGHTRLVPLPPEGDLVIGRAPGVGLQLQSPSASRQHARLRITPTTVALADLNSHNGTRLNGERLAKDDQRQVAAGDIITICDTTLVLQTAVRQSETLPAEGRVLDLGSHTALVADPAMVRLYAQIERLGPSDLSVLVQGETGTGKELCAAALHHYSRRRGRPFVAINCATLQENLAESELFGHERGAFSGAVAQKQGRLEIADGGTLFLDEIGDLPLAVQAKLLRVLENNRLTRVGGLKELPVNVRIVAATHKELDEEIRAGRFRKDLYFRLSVALLRLPPLRERPGELPLLARRLLEQACQRQGVPIKSLSAEAMERLRNYAFPGNVRELRNLMDYLAATVSTDVIRSEDLEERLGRSENPSRGIEVGQAEQGTELRSLRTANMEGERRAIEAALAKTAGNKTRAAKLLDIPLRTFFEKLKRHGL